MPPPLLTLGRAYLLNRLDDLIGAGALDETSADRIRVIVTKELEAGAVRPATAPAMPVARPSSAARRDGRCRAGSASANRCATDSGWAVVRRDLLHSRARAEPAPLSRGVPRRRCRPDLRERLGTADLRLRAARSHDRRYAWLPRRWPRLPPHPASRGSRTDLPHRRGTARSPGLRRVLRARRPRLAVPVAGDVGARLAGRGRSLCGPC